MNNITISLLILINRNSQGSSYEFSRILGVGIDTVKYHTWKLVKEGYVTTRRKGRVKNLTLKGSEYLYELSENMDSSVAPWH